MTEPAEIPPTFVVDITTTWDTKMKGIRAFASQFTPEPGETVSLPFDRFQHAVEVAARRQGQRIGVEFGEAFVTRETMQVSDLASLSRGKWAASLSRGMAERPIPSNAESDGHDASSPMTSPRNEPE